MPDNPNPVSRSAKTKSAGFVVIAFALTLTACSTAGSNGTSPGGAAGDTDFPEDEIEYVIPYPAGSAPDAQGRIIAQQLEQELDVNVIVQNVEGGAGTVGLYELSRADPDGYTIGLGTASVGIQTRTIDTPLEGFQSLTPIAQTNQISNVLYASPERAWESLDDFIAEAQKRPGELQVGLPPAGSTQHIVWNALEESAGIDVREVHFDAGQMILPAVNGTVDASVSQPGPVVQYVDNGQLALLGAFGEQVPEGLDTALIADEYDVNTFIGWEGIFGPAGLPDDIRTVFAQAVERAVESEEYQEFMATTFGVPAYVGGTKFDEIVASTDEVSTDIVEDLGLAKG